MKKLLCGCGLFLASFSVSALSVIGKVDMLEVWKTGNVAFTLHTTVSECNGQFVLNYSENGTQKMYAAVLAAKVSGKSISVNYNDSCGVAENYGASPYNIPKYLYVRDD